MDGGCVRHAWVRLGRNSAQAKSRQLRVTSACECVNVTDKGVPIPMEGSSSYGVTDLGIGELTSLVHEQAASRGSGSVPRVQCVADGEEVLEKAMRDALPFAEFTNDFMHAAGHLNACCERLVVADAAVEAAARIHVARRCKQAGMHWRHHNAACICAMIAQLRSAA